MEGLANLGLTSNQENELKNLPGAFVPSATVWAFGSRATGSARPGADLDLVLINAGLNSFQVQELREQLAESDLPFWVDIMAWEDLPESIQVDIDEHHVVVQAGE